jgi:hypothetical protein
LEELHFGHAVFDVRQQALLHLLKHFHFVVLVRELDLSLRAFENHFLASLSKVCERLVETVDGLQVVLLDLLELCFDLSLLLLGRVLEHLGRLRVLDQTEEQGIVIIL